MDIQQARSYIDAESRELAKCEKEITRLYNALAELEAHRTAVLERIKRCRSWLSPIRRLPPELLAQIFALVCTPEFGVYSLDFRLRRTILCTTPTLALTHVSHHWRVTASASARLWSSIRFTLSHKLSEAQTFRVRSLLKLYLTNSRDHALHLTDLCYYPHHESPISNLLSHAISRIAKLDLVEELGVTMPTHSRLPQWLVDALRTAPQLYHVKLHCLDSINLPYHQLTVLEVTNIINARWLARILKLCINLDSLHLQFLQSRSNQVFDMKTHVWMKTLRRLRVQVERPVELVRFLQQISIPLLSSFRISIEGGPGRLSLVSIVDLIRRSQCRLDEFRFQIRSGCMDIPNADLYDLLVLCPELSQLEVDVFRPHCEDMNPGTFVCQLLDVLAPANLHHTPIPSPKLTHLVVSERWTTYNVNPGTVDALLGRLEARIGALRDYRTRVPVSRWKWDLRFGALPDGLEGFRGRIEKLAECGLKLQAPMGYH
ncbi:hypothetical protein VNI00_016788 [Paramarasmius palmivorus]|uniref:F-box domain-containing protein n=1 Tax=Paramarasmius palmivorus TaxID=297713 RepID=A0AAW0BC74_9AGAR